MSLLKEDLEQILKDLVEEASKVDPGAQTNESLVEKHVCFRRQE